MSSEEIKPDAWMSYNNAGGAGLIPYLLKSRAEDNTNLENGEGPETYNHTDQWPQPLYSRETIKQLIKDKRQEFNNGRRSEHPQKVLTELLEEVEQS